MFIAAVGKEAELIRTLLQRACSDPLGNEDDDRMARQILARATMNGVDERRVIDMGRDTMQKNACGRRESKFDEYLAECAAHA